MANTATSTAFPLGYYSGDPNGNSATAEAQWQSQYDDFVQAMGGARPQFMNAFVDFTQDPSDWGSNASWTAWSWAQSGNDYVGPGSGTTPVIGVPMYSTVNGWPGSGGEDPDTFYQQIISGQYDADYKAIVDAWANAGYKTMYLRIAYEFDGNFMSWSPGNSSSPNADADFVKAWEHIANLVHAEGQADGVTVKTVWNPTEINWTGSSPANLYPGNQYVDVIAADVYSPTYPLDLTDWASGGTTQDSSLTQWAASAANREHFWQYPDATQYAPTGSGAGWSLQDAINLAKEEGKPLAIAETGAGGNGTTTGPLDDPAFAQWLAGDLHAAESQGVQVSFVDIWDGSMSDGDWDFSDPGAGKPQEEAAWDQYFGAGSGTSTSPTTTTITTTSGQSTTVVIVGNTASVTANGSTTQDNLSGGVTINANGSDKISIDKTSTLNVTVNGGAGRLTVSDAGSGNLTFKSGSGNVTLVGGSGTNNIALGSCSGGNIFFDGNMSVTGGSGPFNWEFTKGDVGNDVIPYKIGHDTIVLNGYGTNASAAITSNTSSGGSTTLVLSDNTHITLTGVAHISDSSIVLR